MSKSREQAEKAYALLLQGPVSIEQLKEINPKYFNDPIYFVRRLLKKNVKTNKVNGKTVYTLEKTEALTIELPQVEIEIDIANVTLPRRYLIPEWEGSAFQKWAKNFCAKNAWRVKHVLGDYDDCLAKCALDYVICCKRYGATVNSAKHFMYMYIGWVIPEFHTLALKDGHTRTVDVESYAEEAIDSDAELAVRFSEASDELKSVMKIFFDAPQEIMELLRQEAKSCHPKQFWRAALNLCKINPTLSAKLAKELRLLLSK